jgi:hypothetical protein
MPSQTRNANSKCSLSPSCQPGVKLQPQPAIRDYTRTNSSTMSLTCGLDMQWHVKGFAVRCAKGIPIRTAGSALPLCHGVGMNGASASSKLSRYLGYYLAKISLKTHVSMTTMDASLWQRLHKHCFTHSLSTTTTTE